MAAPTMIEAIKILRERTGAGMMDCKKAIIRTGLSFCPLGFCACTAIYE